MTMKTILLPFLVAILVSRTSGQVPVRAPAPVTLESCDCQCEGTTYLAEDDTVQGNCRSADTSGRRWCYISPDQRTREACKDGFDFDMRYNMFKSYAACATDRCFIIHCLVG